MIGQAALAAFLRVMAQGVVYHKWDDNRDETGEVTLMTTMGNILNKALGNIVSQTIPILGGDIYDLISSGVTGGKYYGDSLQDNSFAVLNKILTDVQNIEAVILSDDDDKGEKLAKKLGSLLTDLSMSLGIPVSAGKNWAKMVMAYAEEISGKAELFQGGYNTTKGNAVAATDKAMTKRSYSVERAQKVIDQYFRTATASDPMQNLKTALKKQYAEEYAAADADTRKNMESVLLGIKDQDGAQIYEKDDLDKWVQDITNKADKEERSDEAAGYAETIHAAVSDSRFYSGMDKAHKEKAADYENTVADYLAKIKTQQIKWDDDGAAAKWIQTIYESSGKIRKELQLCTRMRSCTGALFPASAKRMTRSRP